MKESLELKTTFPVEPQEIYNGWLDSKIHSQMTGNEASCSSEIGGEFSAWNGYISGKNIELKENHKIVQSWRTSEFDEKDEDSLLVITLTKKGEGTEISLTHTNIPEGQTQYEQGWKDFYFTPMQAYFEK